MGKEPFEREFTISGLSDSPYIQLDKQSYGDLFRYLVQDSENLLAELPTDAKQAYQLFNNAYQNGYILDVWPYRNDIDAYTIDPFVDLISKAGLFCVAIFSIDSLDHHDARYRRFQERNRYLPLHRLKRFPGFVYLHFPNLCHQSGSLHPRSFPRFLCHQVL